MKRLMLLFVAVVALAVSGCAPSCSEVCNDIGTCASKLGWTSFNETTCTNRCDVAVCADKNAALKCLDFDTCPGTASALVNGVDACVSANLCVTWDWPGYP